MWVSNKFKRKYKGSSTVSSTYNWLCISKHWMTYFLIRERLGYVDHGFGLPPGSQPSLQRIHQLHSVFGHWNSKDLLPYAWFPKLLTVWNCNRQTEVLLVCQIKLNQLSGWSIWSRQLCKMNWLFYNSYFHHN